MSYKQHNSPFNLTAGSVYSSPKKATFGDEAATLGKKTLDFATDMENALGTTSTEDLTNADEEIATNSTDGALANTGEISEWEQDAKIYGKMTTRSGDLARKSNDESLPPRIRAGAKRKLANQQSREKLQEERNFGEGGRNERHAEKLRIKEEKKLLKIKERNSNRRDKVQDKTDEWDGPIYDPDSNRRSNSPFMMKKQNNMTTQINSRGSAFPMVNPDMDDPTAIPPNRAGGAIKSDVLEQSTPIADPGLKPASQVPINNTFSDLSSSVGEVNQSMNPMAPGQDNTQDQIAQAQENLGTDAATNTPPNIMGGAGMGMFAPPPESKKEKNLLRWVGDEKKKKTSNDDGTGGGVVGFVLPGKGKGTNMQGPAKKDWIQEGIDSGGIKEGGLHKTLGIPEDQTIPYAKKVAASKSDNPKERKQGKLAITFANMSKKRKK